MLKVEDLSGLHSGFHTNSRTAWQDPGSKGKNLIKQNLQLVSQPISNMKMPSCILNFLTSMDKLQIQIEALHLQGEMLVRSEQLLELPQPLFSKTYACIWI